VEADALRAPGRHGLTPNRKPAPGRGARTLLWQWLAIVLWAGLIFAFSTRPNLRFVGADNLDFIVRKAGHMFAFGVLAVLLWRALTSAAVKRALAWSWVLTVAYAATDEFHQSFTQGRHASIVDVGIDSAGAVIALCLLVAWLALRRRSHRSAQTG
jgi:VanZ family protein